VLTYLLDAFSVFGLIFLKEGKLNVAKHGNFVVVANKTIA
jgi:hypothetical protein